jgi:hypothetical protein
MSFTIEFAYPFYEGVGSSSDTPQKWDVALNGRGYMLDTKHAAFAAGIDTIPLIRQQADNSDEPGESSINPEDLWPRAQSSWHHGAGQAYLDAPDSDRARFRASYGVDVWTRGKLGLLNDVLPTVLSSANTNLQVLRVGTYLYVSDGAVLKYALTPYSSWTSSSIAPGQSIKSITSDGYTVYSAAGSAGVYKGTIGSNSNDGSYNALACTLLGYTKGRLMAANGNAIYNIISTSTPTALFTHPNSDFKWVGFAEGQAVIYAAGYSGDKSLIYRTAVKADGTALDTPVVAGELPDGEIVRTIQGYLGFLVIGTDLGFRVATQDGSGNLTLGALVSTGQPVRAFEPQDRFVWFGWENYDASHSGLGRLDLTAFTAEGAPAYATDLMVGNDGAPVQGALTSIVTDSAGKRVFAIAAKGIYVESSLPVASGTLDSGQVSFGIPDPKIALRVALKHKPLPAAGSVSVYVSPDDGTLVFVGSSTTEASTSPAAPIKVPELAAQLFEVRLVLTGDAEVERYDFRAYPASSRGRTITVPILLHQRVLTATGDEQHVDVRAEYDAIESYVGTRRLISYQEMGWTVSVFVQETQFQRHHPTEDRTWWDGTLVLKLKVLGE